MPPRPLDDLDRAILRSRERALFWKMVWAALAVLVALGIVCWRGYWLFQGCRRQEPPAPIVLLVPAEGPLVLDGVVTTEEALPAALQTRVATQPGASVLVGGASTQDSRVTAALNAAFAAGAMPSFLAVDGE
jgi:uncharacterized membrane protein YcjF (UPF0283 family)